MTPAPRFDYDDGAMRKLENTVRSSGLALPAVKTGADADNFMTLADWRRRVSGLYAEIRQFENPRAAWAHWRTARDELFAKHPQSPLPPAERAAHGTLEVFDYDPAFRFLVKTVPASGEATLTAGRADGVIEFQSCARTVGLKAALGAELTLYWLPGYAGGLFLPFRDGTAGRETYGGGRYLLDAAKGADLGERDGRLVLDFNFAYHPSCCYSPEWVCPLPPPSNHFSAPVRAGERLPQKKSRR
jgi:uncharacterized protein (DUF1684 family)